MKTAITPTDVSSDESIASRRSFVAAAVAIGVAGTTEAADAQTPQNPRFQNPSGLSAPRGYSHVVEVTGPGGTRHWVPVSAGPVFDDNSGLVEVDGALPPGQRVVVASS